MAAETIGELLVRVGIDNKGFKTGIDSMNRSMRITKAEFDTASAKMGELLQDAYKKAAESKQADSEATAKLQIKMLQAEKTLYNMEKGLRSTNSELKNQSSLWAKYSSGTDQASQSVQRATAAIKASVAAAAAAVGLGIGAAVNTFADFEAEMDAVGAKADASNAQIKEMTDQAIELGGKTSFSAREAAAGMNELAAAGMNSQQIMAAMPGVLAAAAASGEDMTLVAETMSSTINSFGMEASQASHVADVLAKSANMSAIGVQDMAYSLKFASPVAAALKYSVEEVGAALVEMGNAGIKGEQAGTTLRGALIRLVDPPKEAADQLSALNISITDSQGKMKGLGKFIGELNQKTKGMTEAQKAAALSAIFGTEAVSGMLVLVNQGPEAFDKYTQALINSGGAADETAAKMRDNLKGSFDELSGSAESFSIAITEKLSPAIRALSDTVSKGFGELTELLNPPEPSMAGFKQLDQGIKSGFGAINWEEIGQKAGEGIVKGLSKIGESIQKVDWASIGRQSAGAMLGFVIGLVAGLLDPSTWIDVVKNNWKPLLEIVLGIIFLPESWIGKIGQLLAKIPFAGKILAWVVESVSKVGKQGLEPLKNLGESLLDGLGKGLGKGDKLFPMLRQTIDDAIKGVKDKSATFQIKGMEFMSNLGEGVGKGFGNLRNKLIEIGNNVVDGLTQGIKNKIGSVSKVTGELAETIKNKIKSALHISSPSKVMEEFGGYVSEGLAVGIEKKKSKVEEQVEKVSRAVQEAGQKMLAGLDRQTNISAAKFNLAKTALGNTAAESEKLKLDLLELQQTLNDNASKVDILAVAYETARKKLGEYSDVTKDYAQQLALAKIEQDNLHISSANKQQAIQAALRQEEEERYEKTKELIEKQTQKAQDAYESLLDVAQQTKEKEESNYKNLYDRAKEYYDSIVEQAKDAHDAEIAMAEANKNERVAALQTQLNQLDKTEETRDSDKQRKELEQKAQQARGSKARAKAQAELDEWLRNEQVRLQKESIQAQIQAAENQYERETALSKQKYNAVEQEAKASLKQAEADYNSNLSLVQSHYNQSISAAKSYYSQLGYMVDEVTGKLQSQKSEMEQVQEVMARSGLSSVSSSSSSGSFQNNSVSWNPTTGTRLRDVSIPGVSVTNDNAGTFRFQSDDGSVDWSYMGSMIPGISNVNGYNTIVDPSAFKSFAQRINPKLYADGTNYHPGGLAVTGEEGLELLNLPRGTSVSSNRSLRDMLEASLRSIFGGISGGAAGARGSAGNVQMTFAFNGPISIPDESYLKALSYEVWGLAQNEMRKTGQRG